MIGVDWGTSNFRAFRFDDSGAGGHIIDRRSCAVGILQVPEGKFEATLREHVGDWLQHGEDRILLSGMIGSRQGWVEAEYVTCPVTLYDLANSAVRVPFAGAEVLLVPGVQGVDSDGIPEVMRGEETEIMGLLRPHPGQALVCLPGTHSKWIQLRQGAIVSFATCMTGEVFTALRKATILGRSMSSDTVVDQQAFLRGVVRSGGDGGLLHHLFSVRTLALTGQLQETAAASYLSGLLIGQEIRAVMPQGAQVHLAGSAQLCSLYSCAIESCGGSFTLEEDDAAARGLAAIGRRVSWTERSQT
ncbi:MAG: 2-dehydro-3-deoxygalactonokinase [Acidobacteriota bacterium]|nr:2-dehydro-3-deoxygalactonokinase [Acidobacteriota bacterium]